MWEVKDTAPNVKVKGFSNAINNFNKVSTSRPFILNTGGKVYSHSRVLKILGITMYFLL